ncbi:MAG: phage virion morphogenesis protein [Kiritimatiellia bacterium]
MSGSGVTLTYDDAEVLRMLDDVAARCGDMSDGLQIVGEVVQTSVQRNFEAGGRPGRWKPLSAKTLKYKKNGKILVDKGMAGGLLGSIHYTVGRNSVIIGTDKIYAAAHQFGYSPRNLSARPFLMVQDEDTVEIIAELADYIEDGR